MRVVFLISFVLYLGITYGVLTNHLRKLCFKVKDKMEQRVVVYTPYAYGIPPLMGMQLDIHLKSKKDDSIIRSVKQEYQLERTSETCGKSFEITGYTDAEIYRIYSISLALIDSSNIINEFKFEDYDSKVGGKEELIGAYGGAVLEIDYKKSPTPIEESDLAAEFDGSELPALSTASKCLFLQHEGLQLKMPINHLSTGSIELLTQTNHILFVYNDNHGIVVDTVYDSWVDHCVWHGRLGFDFVVKEKIDNSVITVIFLNWVGERLKTLEYKYSSSSGKLEDVGSDTMGLPLSLTVLVKSKRPARSNQVFLDQFIVRTVQCEYHRQNVEIEVGEQFEVERYRSHLLPFRSEFTQGIFGWRPLRDHEYVARVIKTPISCNNEEEK